MTFIDKFGEFKADQPRYITSTFNSSEISTPTPSTHHHKKVSPTSAVASTSTQSVSVYEPSLSLVSEPGLILVPNPGLSLVSEPGVCP